MSASDWTAVVVADARKAYPSVPEGVANCVHSMLTKVARERSYTAHELNLLSDILIAEMKKPAPPAIPPNDATE